MVWRSGEVENFDALVGSALERCMEDQVFRNKHPKTDIN